jgi:hypothetical protein
MFHVRLSGKGDEHLLRKAAPHPHNFLLAQYHVLVATIDRVLRPKY